jgi:hypothetical protein
MDEDIHSKCGHRDSLIVQSQLRNSTIKVETHGKDSTKEYRKLLSAQDILRAKIWHIHLRRMRRPAGYEVSLPH